MTSAGAPDADPAITFAKQANGETWALLEKATRTPDEATAMVIAAYASLYHWNQVGGPEQRARAEWLVSRVMVVLQDPDAALHHARRSAAICADGGVADFDLGYAHEGLARAHACAGDTGEAAREHALAVEAGRAIADAEDRQIFESDLTAGPWFGVQV